MEKDLIIFDKVSKNLGRRSIIKEVSFSIGKGDIYVLVGPNGSGKTTLIRLMLGLLNLDKGRVLVFGSNPEKAREQLRTITGVVLEQDKLWPYLTLDATLNLLHKAKSGDYPVAHQLSMVKRKFGIEDAGKRVIAECSKGTRRRISLACALLGTPQLLVLDEPFSGLDPEWKINLREILISIATNNGATIFLTSHELYEVELVATRVGVLNQGVFVTEITSKELQKKGVSLEKAYMEVVNKNEKHL